MIQSYDCYQEWISRRAVLYKINEKIKFSHKIDLGLQNDCDRHHCSRIRLYLKPMTIQNAGVSQR